MTTPVPGQTVLRLALGTGTIRWLPVAHAGEIFRTLAHDFCDTDAASAVVSK